MLRRALSITLYALSLVTFTVVGAVLHLSSSDGRSAARDVTNNILAGLFKGRLHVGSIDTLNVLTGLSARDITLDDAHGARIADGGTLTAGSIVDVLRSVLGRPNANMPALDLRVRSVRLIFGDDGVPTIAGAFDSRDPAANTAPSRRQQRAAATTAPPTFRFPSMRVSVERVEVGHPSVPVTVQSAAVQGAMVTEPFALRTTFGARNVDAQRYGNAQANGDFTLTLPAWTPRAQPAVEPQNTTATQALPFEGRLHAGAHLSGDEVQCDVTLDVDRDGTRIDAQRCLARSRLISRIAGVPIETDASITHVRLSRPPAQPLRIEVDARVADSPVTATLQLDGDNLEASLNTTHFDISRVRPSLPRTNISGRVRFTRNGPSLALDATELDARVGDTAIPPLRARARLRTPELLELEDVEIPSMATHARGTVSLARDTAGDVELDVDGDLRDAHEIELLRQIGLGGSARYRAHVSRRRGATDVSFDANGRNLRVPGGVRIGSGHARGSINIAEDGAMRLRADASGSSVVAAGFGPLDASVHVEGDPRRSLRGRFHGSGDRITALPGDASRGPTRADGSFEIQRDEHGTRVALHRTQVSVRGARATVTASVRAPTRGRPTVHAAIDTDDGGHAAIDVGPEGVRTDLGQLPTEWIAHALGQERGVGGSIAGDLRLHGGRPRGRLQWRGGTLPVVGPVEVDIDASAHEGVDRVVAELRYGTAPANGTNAATARPRVRVDAVFDARRATRGGADGAVQSVRSVSAQIDNAPASLLQQFAPPGVTFAGAANATVTATRPSPEAALATVFGFDVRGFVPSANVRAALTGAIFGRRREPRVSNRGASALTIPLRLRGAVCATVANARTVPERAQTAIAWGADSNDPAQAVPTQCVLREADFVRALVRAEGTVGGPWHPAMTGLIRTIRSSRGSGKPWADVTFDPDIMNALAAATVSLDLHVGPASPAQWPFTPAAARLMPALVRPPVNGTLDSSIHIDGPIRAPSIGLELHATSDAPDWLNPNDQARLDARINITTTRDAATVLDRALVDVDARASLVRQRGSLEDSGSRASLELRTRVQPRALFDGRAGLRSVVIERASVRSNSLDLSRLAWARTNRVEGRASLSLTDTGDIGRPFLLNVNVNDVRVRNQPPANVAFRAGLYDGCALLTQRTDACRARDWSVRSCLAWTPGNQGSAGCDPVARNEHAPTNGLRVLASVPLDGDWHEARVRENEGQIILSAVAFPLEGIAPFAERPPIVHLGGNLTGTLRWQARDPRAFAGFMSVQRGELTIERMGVPIRDIELMMIAVGRQLRFSPAMTMHLGSGGTQGSLSATGVIDLNGRNGELAHIRINPTVDNFPAVQEGNLYAVITGALSFDADLFRDRMNGTLTIRRANVTVPEDSSRSLQSLDEASGVFVLGRSRVSAPTVSRSFTTDLAFRTEEPIFLRRRDFLIGVTTEGTLHYDNAIYLRGAVSQFGRQNFFELFGKRFYFDRVSVLFDGSSSIDPLLDVALHYDSPTDGRIAITVTGRKNSPEIRFSAERYPGASDAEILAMLVLGRRESRGASDQATLEQQGRQAAASLLTAVLYGFGAGQVQRALESTGMGFVPTVIAEPGADGTALSRLGIGVLPSFLGNRVYIEGTYNNTQATGQGAQLLIDATINDHFSVGGVLGTSTNNGQRFGLDFFFTP